jgi:Glu-tRNA(Gln) amidotransferase subunit E-like FAD-binding protein
MIPDQLKKYIDELINKELNEMDGGATSTTASAGGYYNSKYFVKNPNKQGDYLVKTFGYKKVKPGMPSDSKIYDYKQFPDTPKPKRYKLYKESELKEYIKQELLNEISYRRFNENVSKVTPERKITRALHEVTKRIKEIEQVIEYSTRLKTENTIKKESFWETKTEQLVSLSERLNELSSKIKTLSK